MDNSWKRDPVCSIQEHVVQLPNGGQILVRVCLDKLTDRAKRQSFGAPVQGKVRCACIAVANLPGGLQSQ